VHIVNPLVFSVILAAVTVSAAAQAGPAVSVTFKNNGTAAAIWGARCDVKITSVDFATHAWAVEFAMK
jgi:hypothetical protein